MDTPSQDERARLGHLRSDGTFGDRPAPADPGALATQGEVAAAIAQELEPLKTAIARLQRQVHYLQLGPDPW